MHPLAAALMCLQGGAVPASASPSRGQNTDDVPARLNAGEEVIPRNVVQATGGPAAWTQFLNNARGGRPTYAPIRGGVQRFDGGGEAGDASDGTDGGGATSPGAAASAAADAAAAANGYGFGSGIGGPGSAAAAASIGASTTGTGSFGDGFGGAGGTTSVSAADSPSMGAAESIGTGGVVGPSGSSDAPGGASQYGGTPGPSAYGNTANAYGSNVSQPGGALGNSVTALDSQNQIALNNAAGLHGSAGSSSESLAALAHALAQLVATHPDDLAAQNQLGQLTALTGETISPGGIYGIGNANMGAPSASVSAGPDGTNYGVNYGNATTLGNNIGTANIGTGPSVAESPADTTAFGPNAGQAMANEANPAAMAAAEAADAKMGVNYGMATSPGVQSIRASLGMPSEFGPSPGGGSGNPADAPSPAASNMSAAGYPGFAPAPSGGLSAAPGATYGGPAASLASALMGQGRYGGGLTPAGQGRY